MLNNTWIKFLFLVSIFLTINGELSREERAVDQNDIPHFKIATILISPYTMMKRAGLSMRDLEGFIPDLVDALASSMRFTYQLQLVKDGKYGHCDSSENETKCVGLIGEVVRNEVDIAAAPLTVTRLREKHVDFVRAFKDLGTTVLVKKPDRSSTEWPFQFDIIKPLKVEIYAIVFAVALMVGLVLWLMNRFNPYEWGGQQLRGLVDEEAGSRFNLASSIWFVFASLQWQGYDIGPRSLASRVLTIFWFAFVTVTLVTYTGSLMNHLFWASSVKGQTDVGPFGSIRDLVESKNYDYGALAGGSTYNQLNKLAEGEMYDTMRAYWKSKRGKTMFVNTIQQGVKRVREEKNYAFFTDSTTAKYLVNRKPCDLMVVKDVIHPKSYALAVSHGFKHLDSLHISVMELIETGVIARLEEKWWVEKGECYEENKKDKLKEKELSLSGGGGPRPVGLDNFWGALVLIAVGLILSIITAFVELVFFKIKGQKDQ